MNTTLKNNKSLIKLKAKKKRQQRFRFLILISCIIIIFCFIFIRNAYISNKCNNLLYAIDHYFTTYSNKDLRLIKVDSISVVKQSPSEVIIEAVGTKYSIPHNKINVMGNFVRNEKGSWELTGANLATEKIASDE